MKLLNSRDGLFSTIETPDLKLYTIKELKNCTIPPLFILYQHQLFVFSYINQGIGYYKGLTYQASFYTDTGGDGPKKETKLQITSPTATYVAYDFTTHTIASSFTLDENRYYEIR